MTRRAYIVLVAFLALTAMAAFWAGYHAAPAEQQVTNTMTTDAVGAVEADIPHADPAIAGHWISKDNPQWHKVYLDDFDEEQQLFWGKEWDESEDVFEYDLNYHGNGWFRWEKKDNVLREYATMDNRDVPIHRAYVLHSLSARNPSPVTDSLVYHDMDYKKRIYRFSRLY